MSKEMRNYIDKFREFINENYHDEYHKALKDINVSFENLQKSKNLGSFVESSPVGAISRLGNALKGMKDVVSISSLTPMTAISPPVTPIGAGAKLPGLMSRKG